jgi:hypothetical protein
MPRGHRVAGLDAVPVEALARKPPPAEEMKVRLVVSSSRGWGAEGDDGCARAVWPGGCASVCGELDQAGGGVGEQQ